VSRLPQAGEPLAVDEVKGAGAKGDIGADSVISPEVRAEFAVRWNDATDLAALAAWRL
jgi:hypothetical protein